jgi:hypothetical protein
MSLSQLGITTLAIRAQPVANAIGDRVGFLCPHL